MLRIRILILSIRGVRSLASFPGIPSLRGELKRTEIRGGIRYQLTTREFIVQRYYRTYRIALENIIGFMECSDLEYQTHKSTSTEQATGKPYKVVATLLYLVSPNGVLEQTQVSFYIRLSSPFATQLEKMLESSGAVS